jgi:hypothetical protein
MSSRDADRRVEILDSHPEGSQRNWREEGLGASSVTARREKSGAEAEHLLAAVVERKNMWLALKQVERNSGAAGVDNMTVGSCELICVSTGCESKQNCWREAISRSPC